MPTVKAIIESGVNYIISEKIPEIPYILRTWIQDNPDQAPEDGMILSAPVFDGGARRKAITYHQYRDARARRSLRGIDEQVAKAERAAAGKGPVKRNRFLKIKDETQAVNRHLEHKARTLAARPVFAYQRESIEAHLNIVVAALAVAQRLAAITGWSRKKFLTTIHGATSRAH